MQIDAAASAASPQFIDVRILVGLVVAATFSLAVMVVPLFQRPVYSCLLALLAAAAYYGQAFVGFGLVNIVAYVIVCWLGRQEVPARRWTLSCAAMAVLVLVFAAGRLLRWEQPVVVRDAVWLSVYSLGMWHALRLITLFWEVGSGAVDVPSISQYSLWLCLPFTLGGPLLRMSQMPANFSADWRTAKSAGWLREAGAATAKLVAGMGLIPVHNLVASRWPISHSLNVAISMFLTGPFSFYLTAAGNFQWMEILARPAGVNIPPSFNYPVGRQNISAFWMNWNMTATFVFRDCLFFNRWGRPTYNVYFNTILLFTLVGLWHAANPYWIMWGFLHGLLFTCFLLWRKYGERLRIAPLRATAVSRTAARVLTYCSVCISWYLPSKILQKLAGA